MKKIALFILFLGLGLVLWFPIFNIFYLQEEWLGLGHILVEGSSHPFSGVNFLQFILGENRSLARVLGLLFFGYFRFNTLPVATFSIFLHIINSYLVFLLAQKITRKSWVAFLASLVFLVSSVSSNTVYWFSTSVGTLPATTLVLLATFCYFNFLEKGGRKFIVLAFILLYTSLFFKEIGIYLFALFPFTSLLFKKWRLNKFLNTWWPYLVFFLIIALVRIGELKGVQGQRALFLTGESSSFLATLIARVVFYPLTSFSLQFIPPTSLFNFGRFFTNLYYPFFSPEEYLLIVQTVVLDLFAVLFTVIILKLLYIWGSRLKALDKKYLILLVSISVLSFLPYIVISKNFSYLESRYYYLSLTTGSIIFAWLVGSLFLKKRKVFKIATMIFVVTFLAWHTLALSKDLSKEGAISAERKNFISQLKERQPTLSQDKNIFFITSDEDYFATGNKVPFQQGTGYTLMVLYYDSGKIPNQLLAEDFLFEIGSQGYKEIGEKGFGYFWNLGEINKAIQSNKLLEKDIIYLKYDNKRLEELRVN